MALKSNVSLLLSVAGAVYALTSVSAPLAAATDSDACATAVLNCPSVAALLSEREGYGRGTTGGLGGQFVTVTSNLDNPDGKPLPNGAITLRDAIKKATKGPTWINFASDMEIHLSPYKYLAVPSNTTVDGRGHKIVLYQNGFMLSKVNNIILTHVTLNGQACDGKECHSLLNPDGTLFMSPPEGVRLYYTSRVWIDHLDIANITATGKPIGIARASTDITISWTIVRSSLFGMLIYDDESADGGMTNSGAPPRVTVHHSMFVANTQRNPRVSSTNLHFYNNVVYNWYFYAMSVGANTHALTEGNLFFNNKNRKGDDVIFRETIAGIVPGSPNSCTIPTDPTKAVYCADFSSGIPSSNGEIFDNADAYYMPTAAGNGYYQLHDNNFQLVEEYSAVGQDGIYGAKKAGVIVNDPSDSYAPDYCYAYESGEAAWNLAKPGMDALLNSKGKYDLLFPSSVNALLPAPIGALLPNSGNSQASRFVGGVRCPAANVETSVYGGVFTNSVSSSGWPTNLSFRENSSYSTHQANIYFSLPQNIEQSRPESFSLKFLVRSAGQRNLQLQVLDAKNQSGIESGVLLDLSSGVPGKITSLGGLALNSVHVADIGGGVFRVFATVVLPSSTHDLRLYFGSAGGTTASSSAGLDLSDIRFEPSQPGDDFGYATKVSVGTAGATALAPLQSSVWPSDLSFRENSSYSTHQANIYFWMTDTVQRPRPASWNLSFQAQAVGNRQLDFYIMDVDHQDATNHRLILDLAKGTQVSSQSRGGLVLSNIQVKAISGGVYQITAIAAVPSSTNGFRLYFGSRGGTTADPKAGLNIKAPMFAPTK